MRILLFVVSILLLPVFLYSQQPLNLVPWPVEVKQQNGSYLLKNKITVSSNFPKQDWTPLFNYFRDEMKKMYGTTVSEAVKGQKADIAFEMQRMPTGGKPAYQLAVTATGIRIVSNFDLSAFHGMQTFFQLIPLETAVKKEIPFVEIFDHARFEYRGMHLDVSRHFFPVSFVKKYIDYLAYHKFNRFHWHLTEDQGWRIQIKKYPLLTEIGGWRNGTIIGRYPGKGSDNLKYGGFYTQAEIKDVVNYAKLRHIEVIPEIEMPGHGSAAIAAYPWLSCFPEKPTVIPANMISRKSVEEQKNGRIKLVQETWGVFDDVFCAGNDTTFAFLQNVIDEVLPLFPSKYFHIGGDECPKTHWKQCPKCQQRMKDHNLKDEHELQSYFVQRIEKYLNSKGKTLIGWDEILEGGLAPNAIVMSWRGEAGGIEAAKQKHQVIMTPGNPVYFDYTQSQQEDSVTIGGYNPLENVYAYEPIPAVLSEEEGKYIIGAQANLWTEYIKNTRKVEYMIFPRLTALSEVLWSPKENRNWKTFESRLPGIIKRYEKWKANYSKAYFDLKTTVAATSDHSGVKWIVSNKFPASFTSLYEIIQLEEPDSVLKYDTKDISRVVGYELTYTRNNMIKQNSPNNPEELIIKKPGHYRLEAYKTTVLPGSHHIGRDRSLPILTVEQDFYFNKATGKSIKLQEEATKKYPGDGAFTLVNGIQNTKGMARTSEFLGFEGTDCIAIIDLGESTTFSEVAIHHLEQPGSWIYSPSAIDLARSDDGQQFAPANSNVSMSISPFKDKTTLKFATPVTARYIKVSIFNIGTIPTGKPGEGHKAWLFVDEIEVL